MTELGWEPKEPVYARTDICVRLGKRVCCDGFDRECDIRIQTHAHYDHLAEFYSSKSNQKMIVMTRPTMELLIAEGNLDLPSRNNVLIAQANGEPFDVLGTRMALFPSAHMIGSVIPVVWSEDGEEIYAFSSDFSWPIPISLPQVDALVVDALYGDPSLVRDYSEQDAIDALLEVVGECHGNGPLIIRGHRGRLQYALDLLRQRYNHPFILGENAYRAIDVFCRQQGISARVTKVGSKEASELLRARSNCFVFLEERDRRDIVGINTDTLIWLTKFSLANEPVVTKYPRNNGALIKVGLSDHADFRGTESLIAACEPKLVIANGAQGGDADALVNHCRSVMGFEATSKLKPKNRFE